MFINKNIWCKKPQLYSDKKGSWEKHWLKSTYKDVSFNILLLRAELFIRCWLDSNFFGSLWLFSLVLEYKCNHWSSPMTAEHQLAPWHMLYLGSIVLHSEIRGKQHVVHTAVCNGLEYPCLLILSGKSLMLHGYCVIIPYVSPSATNWI